MEPSSKTDDTVLAARCPAGWRRDPMTGRPVMPCIGKLLFPCQPEEVPTHADITFQLKRVWYQEGEVFYLAYAVLTGAAEAKRRRGECMHLCDERAVSNAVDAALRESGTVRIRRVAGGWEEVSGVSEQQRTIEPLSSGWHWTDESLPGIGGRLLISVGGSCREGFYKDGKFSDKYGEQKPEAWMSLPMAPRYRNGQYVGY